MRGCILLLAFAATAAAQSLLSRADQAWSKGDVAAFKDILSKAESAQDRAGAERRQGVMSWRFLGDFDAAVEHFMRAEQTSETLAARARMETARGRYDQAREHARGALRVARTDRDRNEAKTMFAHATVEEALAGGTSAATAEALQLVSEAVRSEPGMWRPARLMYGLALLRGNTTLAEEALRAYRWGGKPLPLYPEAGLAGKPAATVRYAKFCYRIRSAVDEFYRWRCSRRHPIGHLTAEEQTKLRELVLGIAADTWPDVTSADQLHARIEPFRGFLRFVAWGLEFGHRVIDSNEDFEQYGRRTRGAFIVLDDMISNGSITWYSDGASQIGGWAGPPMIQVRNDAPIRAWVGLTEPERADTNRRIAEATAADEDVARKNPHAYLAGLAMRMRLRAGMDVLRAFPDRLAFLGETERRHVRCVQAHETRHQIDPEGLTGMERERNAALSQVIFSGYPPQCMAGILTPNLGLKDNGSAEAAGEIMKGIVRWIEAHADQIAAFDKSRPALPQFDKLTDPQIVEAFRSMDPLAVSEPGRALRSTASTLDRRTPRQR